MITVENDTAFFEALNSLDQDVRKLLLARRDGNYLTPVAEIRKMCTRGGGYQFGIASINFMNQRESGIYSSDPTEIYLRAIDIEHSYNKRQGYEWIPVQDCEHTINTEY